VTDNFTGGASSNGLSANAHHLAELEARYDQHVAALKARAAAAQAALDRGVERLAEAAGESQPPR
jgi:hypothetical protein